MLCFLCREEDGSRERKREDKKTSQTHGGLGGGNYFTIYAYDVAV
jgi:hypothetical protein